MERSKRYDWFKNKHEKGKDKKDIKAKWKLIWKFTRIFLIFMLFFTSLYGCVQTITLKQNNYVGRGIELYLNESDIEPHVTHFQEYVHDKSQIYYLTPATKNINIMIAKSNGGSDVVKKVHAEINSQGALLSDANGGVNEAIQIRDSNGNPINGEVIATDSKTGAPIVLSTSSKTAPSYVLANAISYPNLNTTIDSFKDKIRFLSSSGTYANHYYLSTFDTSLSGKVTNSPRISFRDALFNKLNIRNWMVDALTLTNSYEFPSNTSVTDADTKAKFEQVVLAQASALNILYYLGYENNVSGISTNMNSIAPSTRPLIRAPSDDFMPGLLGSDYRPIVTWGHAWNRGVGPFYGLFVWPIAKLQLATLSAFPFMSGWESLISMILVIFLLRFIGFLLSFKSTLQQTRMQELNIKKAAIDAKYQPYKGNKQMMARQKQEIAEMYKKENISPFGVFSNLFVTMPIFLSIWRVIGSIQHFKTTEWLGINFAATSWRELFAGQFQYLPLMFFAVGLSILSQLYPKLLTRRRDKQRSNAHLKQAMKKSNRTQNIIMIVTAALSLIFTAGTQIYWIVGGIWGIIQAQLTHHILNYRHSKVRAKRV